jgi:hypothetical protein
MAVCWCLGHVRVCVFASCVPAFLLSDAKHVFAVQGSFPPAWRHIRRGNGIKVVCRGAAVLGGAGCAHVSAHGASKGSVWSNSCFGFRQGEKNNDSSISHHTISMVFFAHFIIAIATETAPSELPRARFGPPTTLPEGFQPLVATTQPR